MENNIHGKIIVTNMLIVFKVVKPVGHKQRKRHYQFAEVLSSIEQMCLDTRVVILVETLAKSEPIRTETAPN